MVKPVGEWSANTKVVTLYSGKGHKIKEKPRIIGYFLSKGNNWKIVPEKD